MKFNEKFDFQAKYDPPNVRKDNKQFNYDNLKVINYQQVNL